eukprot:scaffold251727_cov19-Prasinocladus_malaysianus.AAC.1
MSNSNLAAEPVANAIYVLTSSLPGRGRQSASITVLNDDERRQGVWLYMHTFVQRQYCQSRVVISFEPQIIEQPETMPRVKLPPVISSHRFDDRSALATRLQSPNNTVCARLRSEDVQDYLRLLLKLHFEGHLQLVGHSGGSDGFIGGEQLD